MGVHRREDGWDFVVGLFCQEEDFPEKFRWQVEKPWIRNANGPFDCIWINCSIPSMRSVWIDILFWEFEWVVSSPRPSGLRLPIELQKVSG